MRFWVFAGMLVAGLEASAQGAAPSFNEAEAPGSQVALCRVIDDASSAYSRLHARRRAEPNGIIRDEIAAQITQLRQTRGEALLSIFGPPPYSFSAWRFQVITIETSMRPGTLDQRQVNIVGRAPCRTLTTFHFSEPLTPDVSAMFRSARPGTIIEASGTIILLDAARNPAWRVIEGSLTERGSLIEPEFRFVRTGGRIIR